MKRFLLVVFVLVVLGAGLAGADNAPAAPADGYIDFEDGVDGQVIRSTIPGLQFTTTEGYDWIYGDWRTDDYNGPYPNGEYVSNGNFFAWLGVNQGAGRIDFINGCASYVQAYVSTYSGLVADAYYMDGRLAATASVGPNLNTGQMSRLRVDAIPGDCFHYVIFHDSGNYWLIDDLSTDAAGVPDTRPPVIVLPGLMGSRLDAYDSCAGEGPDDAEEIWPAITKLLSLSDDHLDVLRLKPNGREPASACDRIVVSRLTDINYENGAIRLIGPDWDIGPFPFDFYANLIDSLRLKGFNVYGYGFDWRLDIRTIVDQPGEGNDLDDYIDQVLADTGATQVNLVGHSLGGLVARQYVTSDPAHAAKVEQVISLGTPYLGAPQSLKAIRWGDPVIPAPADAFIKVNDEKAKELLANAPSLYQILPSRRYFNVGGSFFVNRGDSLSWTEADTVIQAQHNSHLAVDADAFHTPAMDDWASFASDVAFRLIVGSGKHDTPGILRETIAYDFFGRPHTEFTMRGVNGDGTVPLASASLQGNGTSYRGDTAIWYTNGLDHQQLAKEPFVVEFVGSLLATPPDLNVTHAARLSPGPIDPNASPLYISPVDRFGPPHHVDNTPPPPEEMSTEPFPVSGGQITAIGEAQLHVYDDQGRHTGFVSSDSYEADIPSSSYTHSGNTTTIAVPAGATYRVEVVSDGAATFDLRFESLEGVEGNLVQRTISYADAPLGDEGTAVTDFTPLDTGPASSMSIDVDGDGQSDETMPPTGDLGPTESLDLTEPAVVIDLDGAMDSLGNYVGMVLVTLSAEDEGSGVARLVYTLEDGGVDQEYLGPFEVNTASVDAVLAHAVDYAGNQGWAFAELTADPNSIRRLFLPITLFTPYIPPSVRPLLNGNFESGATGWTEYSRQGLHIIYNKDEVDGLPVHGGRWVAWLGGYMDEVSYIEQEVTVPADRPYLAYYQAIASDDECGHDFGGVLIDDHVVDSYELCRPNNTASWARHVVDLRAYAGQTVRLQIRAETNSSHNSNLFVDDVSFNQAAAVREGGPVVTPFTRQK